MNGKLILIFVISIFLCFIPVFLHSKFSPVDADYQLILNSFDSVALKVVLGSCISTSVPLLLEIVRDCALARSTRIQKNILCNLFLVCSLIIPDIMLFAYVVPKDDFRLFICVNQGRTVALISSIYAYLLMFGGDFFKRRIHMGWYILFVMSSLLFVWEAFGSADPKRLKAGAAAVCTICSMVIFLYISVAWFRKQYQESEHRLITTDEYCCSIYLVAFSLCFTGVIITWFAFGRPTFAQLNSEYLIITNIFYAMFYVVISVFQGEYARRDEIIEVGVTQHLSNELFPDDLKSHNTTVTHIILIRKMIQEYCVTSPVEL